MVGTTRPGDELWGVQCSICCCCCCFCYWCLPCSARSVRISSRLPLSRCVREPKFLL